MAAATTTPDATAASVSEGRALDITEAQKQALMDNLQLESVSHSYQLRDDLR